ncbi:MAG: hypothetical protein KA371_00810 [Acidobacteria bacterium]|nr:hypothetical protein [Acidobacteriota bacterium]
MPDDLPELRCRTWRVTIFFIGVAAAIVGPLAVLFALIVFGPAPYLVDRGALDPHWLGAVTRVDGAEVRVIEAADAAGAKAQAERIRAGIATSSATTLPGTFRYRRTDTGLYGVILRVDALVIQVEASEREQLARSLAGLPFVTENPQENLLDRALGSPGTSVAWLALYLVMATVFMARTASWAGTIEPPAGAAASIGDRELRRRLLSLSEHGLPFTMRELPNGDLMAEWRLVEAAWTSIFSRAGLRKSLTLHLRLGANGTVRVVESERAVSWSGGVGGALAAASWSRPIRFFHVEAGSAYGVLYRGDAWQIDAAYNYRYDAVEVKSPVVRTILEAGWTFRPVLSFVAPFG